MYSDLPQDTPGNTDWPKEKGKCVFLFIFYPILSVIE